MKKYDFFKLSTSEEHGEGEHKLFEHVRTEPEWHQNKETLIYGLDSDLIVLGLHHLKYGNIKLLRESPAFMMVGDELHVLDLSKLSEGIRELIGDRMEDYTFLTLFLGNDFMPHFPALNLRTRGFDLLLQTYTTFILPHEKIFDGDIRWDLVQKLVNGLAEREHSTIIQEYHGRNRLVVDSSTEDACLNNTPILKRDKEKFICPISPGWEKRYYDTLLPHDIPDVCKKYTDMLLWNMKYYTKGCVHWNMCYPFMYPPLLVDLKRYIPDTKKIEPNELRMNEKELLEYVLPTKYHEYIPDGISREEKVPVLEWAYCRYLWESHVHFF